MAAEFEELKQRLSEAYDLQAVNALQGWDQSTYMPAGGAMARARQTAAIGKLVHEKMTDIEVGRLLDKLRPFEESLPYESDDASYIRAARRNYERLTKVPASFMAEFLGHGTEAYIAWTRARPANDFRAVEPHLVKTIELSRRLANFFPGYEHIADPLINFADYGMKASVVRRVFDDLRADLVPMVQSITAQAPADDTCLNATFPIAKQQAFFLQVIKDFGFDFERGRQDISPHPFTTSFSISDVRITVRYKERDLGDAVFSAFHEAGHGMYEQGVNIEYECSPLAGGTSAGVHESQSRLWENIIGRSLPFWTYYYPVLQKEFPSQLNHVELEQFYRAINKVQRSLIRVDADEVTYNLHIMVRFGLELDLLDGKLEVHDLPEAWNQRYDANLGVIPPTDSDGVLQDVHWYGGIVGGSFQGYTLGNILSAQFYAQALRSHPEIPGEISQGDFKTLLDWMRTKIYSHGSKFTAPELIERVTGRPIDIQPYLQYLHSKYGELYTL